MARTRHEAIQEATHGYIGTCEGCGAIRGAVVDTPHLKEETAQVVAEFIRDGLTVTYKTIEEVRRGNWHCTCETENEGEQLSLFGEEVG